MGRKHQHAPFTTAAVLRGIELALRIAGAKASRDLVGYVTPDIEVTATDALDLDRAEAWLQHAKQTRKGSR